MREGDARRTRTRTRDVSHFLQRTVDQLQELVPTEYHPNG